MFLGEDGFGTPFDCDCKKSKDCEEVTFPETDYTFNGLKCGEVEMAEPELGINNTLLFSLHTNSAFNGCHLRIECTIGMQQ